MLSFSFTLYTIYLTMAVVKMYFCFCCYFNRLESATRSLEIRSPEQISIESSAGGISATSLLHLKLSSQQGSVNFDSRSVFLKGLGTASVQDGHGSSSGSSRSSASSMLSRATGSSSKQRSESATVYQVCACADGGKLFFAPPDGACQADNSVC